MKLFASPAVLVSLLVVLYTPRAVEGLPTTPGYITVSLTRAHRARDGDVHPEVSHQQHINRGLIRYAKLTGRQEPAPGALLQKIKDRLDSLEPHVRKRYNHDSIEESISHLESINEAFPGAPPNQAHVDDSETTQHPGYDPSLLIVAVKHIVTEAKTPDFPQTLGLDIQGNELGYMGHVQLGTPPKDFRLLVDTGSADLWVGGENCAAQGGGGCGKHQFLGPSSSSTYNQTNDIWAIRYGSGAVLGHLVYDRFSVAGLTLDSFLFGVASNETIQFTPDRIPFDGIAGTARSVISRQNTKTFVEALSEAGLIKEGIASYKIPRVAGHESDGELTLGAMNPAKYDASTLVELANMSPIGFWAIFMQDVKVNGKSIGLTSRNIILDTGTTLFLAPKEDVAMLHKDIPGAIYNGHSWTIPCTTTATISLNFGGQEFPIDPRDLAFIPLDTRDLRGQCASAITEVTLHQGEDYWLLGDVFLKNVYFSTNVATNRISIARLPPGE